MSCTRPTGTPPSRATRTVSTGPDDDPIRPARGVPSRPNPSPPPPHPHRRPALLPPTPGPSRHRRRPSPCPAPPPVPPSPPPASACVVTSGAMDASKVLLRLCIASPLLNVSVGCSPFHQSDRSLTPIMLSLVDKFYESLHVGQQLSLQIGWWNINGHSLYASQKHN